MLLHIRVLEGEGAIHAASSRCSRGIVVEITDETGRPVDGAAVSFRMPEEGPGATFGRDMRTEIKVTTPDGRAAIYEFQTGSQTGPFQIRVTAVKGQIRAGTVVAQYVSDAQVKSKRLRGTKAASSRKWLIIGAAAAAGAAAVLAGGTLRGSSSGSQNPGSAPTTPPQIGAPSISIGGPQ